MQINGRVALTENSSTPAAVKWQGGKGTFIVEASAFNNGVVSLFAVSPHGTNIPVKDIKGDPVVGSQNDMFHFDLPPGQLIVTIDAVNVPTAVYAYAIGRHQ